MYSKNLFYGNYKIVRFALFIAILAFTMVILGGVTSASSSNVYYRNPSPSYGDRCYDNGTLMNVVVHVSLYDENMNFVSYASDFRVRVESSQGGANSAAGIVENFNPAAGLQPGERWISSKTFDSAGEASNFERCDTKGVAPLNYAPDRGSQRALTFEGTGTEPNSWKLVCGGVDGRIFDFTGVNTPSGIPAGYTADGWGGSNGTARINRGDDYNRGSFSIALVYRVRTIPPPQPSTVGVQSFLSITPGGSLQQANQTMNGSTGVAEFYHRISVGAYDGISHNVSWDVHQQNTANGSCNIAGPWNYVTGGTTAVGGNGTYDVYPRTSVGFNRKTDRAVCQLFRITNTGGGNGGGQVMRQAFIPAPTPATVAPSSARVSATIDAQNGNAAFYHDVVVSNYNRMDHTVSFVIDQFASTANNCTSGGPWQQISSSTVFVNGNGSYRVYGPANAGFDHNTTKQICQRLRITNTGSAAGGGTSLASTVVAGGTITPNAVLSPSGIISPGEVITITPLVGAIADGGNAFPMTYRYTISTTIPVATTPVTPITYNSPVHNISTTSLSTFPQPPTNISLTIPANAPAGAKLCVNVSVTNPTLSRYLPNGSSTGDLCVTIANRPVFIVNGGDLLAGAEVDTGTCGSNSSTDTTIGGWNIGADPTEPYKGASTQLSAFAKNGIIGFATAARGTQGVSPPSGLAFANTSLGANEYGNSFDRVPCIANQWAVPTTVASITDAEIGTKAGSKAYAFPAGNKTLGGITVQNGVQQIIYIDGDLLINDNISYNRSGWASPNDIPALKFVVTGDITIQNNVSNIDGVYVSANNINTCEQTVSSTYFDLCNNQLEVNGSLIAKGTVYFKRTYGELRQAKLTKPYNVAEVVNYRPEVWLANWPQVDAASSNDITVDAESSLPPVL